MRPCEFQGVILCGPGEELYPLTQHAGSVYKSLLPVCNQPLVEHPLKLLEQLGLTDVLILCQSQREADDLSAFIRRRGAASNASLTKVEVWATETSSQPPATATPSSSAAPAAPEKRNGTLNGHTDHDQTHHHHTSATDEGEEYESTAGALRWASHQGLLKSDFVLLPCDLCLAKEHVDATLGALLDRHRRDDCLMSTLLVEAPEDSKAKDAAVLTMMEPTNSLLLDLKEMADFNAEDDIELRPTGFTRTSISTSLNQTHLFICSKRVLTLLHALPHQLHSFRNDIAPFLAKSQWQKGLLDKYKLPHPEDHPQQLAKSHASLSYPLTLSHTTATPPTSNHSVPQTPALAAAHTMAAFPTTESGATSRTTYKKDQSVVYGIWRRADGPCLRANTVESYAELNRVLLSTLAPSSKPSHNYARQVGSDSLVGPNLVLGEKSTVKRSVLGKGVHVGTQTKISNCIIHDNVVLSDNVKLDSCIVASGARIESDVSLTKCEVGSGVEVFAGANAKGEKLAALGE